MTIRAIHRRKSANPLAPPAEEVSGALIDAIAVTPPPMRSGKLRDGNLTWEDLLIWGGVSLGLMITLMLGLFAWWL